MKLFLAIAILVSASMIEAFVPSSSFCKPASFLHTRSQHKPSFLRMTSSTLPEVSSMRVGELKKELESYGMSTKSYFEKSELVTAVEKARSEGETAISSDTSSSSTSSKSSDESSSSASSTSLSREEQLAEEMENCKLMKAGELKKELESYGISTASFFEKSEFVKAVAEARVDGASKKSTSSGEGYAEYADVEVLTDDNAGPRKRSSEEQPQGGGGGNPFGGGMPGGGGNPFGGGMPGGMGGMDMGNIADMMKNMGMGGGGGAPAGGNPFGGGGGGNPFAGANPFGGGMPGGMGGMGGDQMKKAQEMMSNPKVQEIMAKAQSNPKIMKAIQECMSNPMAFAKYQNDPEVGELIRELQKYM